MVQAVCNKCYWMQHVCLTAMMCVHAVLKLYCVKWNLCVFCWVLFLEWFPDSVLVVPRWPLSKFVRTTSTETCTGRFNRWSSGTVPTALYWRLAAPQVKCIWSGIDSLEFSRYWSSFAMCFRVAELSKRPVSMSKQQSNIIGCDFPMLVINEWVRRDITTTLYVLWHSYTKKY